MAKRDSPWSIRPSKELRRKLDRLNIVRPGHSRAFWIEKAFEALAKQFKDETGYDL